MSAFDTLASLLDTPAGSAEHIIKVLDEVSGLPYGVLFPIVRNDPRFAPFRILLPDDDDPFHCWMLEQIA
jgi:hypothetical protein